MDGNRFDHFTKALAAGKTRRSILKGLLGFGGTAAVSTVTFDESDARRSSRTSPTSTSTTPEPLCPAGTIECETNSTGCCAECDFGVSCGYDCCDSPAACCDNECCPSGEVCIGNILDCSNNFCEERCCLDSQICAGRCCYGTCFSPLDSGLSGYNRDCCPPIAGFTFCPGYGDYAGQGLCCSGDTPDCCNDAAGRPVCLTPDQCCTTPECAFLTDPSQCLEGVCSNFECITQTICPDGQSCCPDFANTCCPTGQDCCLRDSSVICLDPNQCCTDDECTEFPRSFCDFTTNTCECTPLTCDDFAQQGMCGTALSDGCGNTLDCGCGENQQCCPGPDSEPGFCRPSPGCCTADDCDPPDDACTTVTCNVSAVCEYDGCQTGFDCCERDVNATVEGACIDPENQCCNTGDCEDLGYFYDCIDCNDQFSCVPDDDGESCDENDCRFCNQGYCQPAGNDEVCEGDGVCCDGFCYDVESCSTCGLAGTSCASSEDCCSNWCCGDVCINPDQCCLDADCGSSCLACRNNSCSFTCEVGDDCCGSNQTCNEVLNDSYGDCVPCRTAQESCDAKTGPDCCDGSKCCEGVCCDEFCITRVGADTCESCVPLKKFGCSETSDCCTGKCINTFCDCLEVNEGSCNTDDNCCDNLVCADSGENNHNGFCKNSCSAKDEHCGLAAGIECCYNHRCISSNGGPFTCQPY